MDTAFTQLAFRLDDKVDGRPISPENVDLPTLRQFLAEVETLIKGNVAGASLADSRVLLKEGSLRLLTVVAAQLAISVQADFAQLARTEDLDSIQPKRAEVIERWQTRVRNRPERSYAFEEQDSAGNRLRIDRGTHFEHKELGSWAEVEKYVTGKVTDLGGQVEHNIHLLLPGNGGTMAIAATEQQLKASPFLYEEVTIHIKARQHLTSRELRDATLVEFVSNSREIDEAALHRLWERGREAWKGVPDAAEWVEQMRGNS